MKPTNQLKGQQNRYLQQHADDPVHWQMWTPETLELARQSNMPILLSIGYSACEWCHVMQRESFADPTTAVLMNENFINIKVDREERPDLDDIFQTAHQLLNGKTGGWPLTVFLCPKTQLPFIAGTYFPKYPTDDRIPFEDLLIRVSNFYRLQQKDFVRLRDQMGKSFAAFNEMPSADEPAFDDLYLLHQACDRLLDKVDIGNGGFGDAPKFAMPFYLWRLLDTVASGGELAKASSQALHLSLHKMADAAFHDQVDGGFFRYTSDEEWRIPHYEKMLSDNAALIGVYAAAGNILNEPVYSTIARDTITWLRRTLATSGGYAASLDAATMEGDGAAYQFTTDDIAAALSPQQHNWFKTRYNVAHKIGEKFVLHCERDLELCADRLAITVEQGMQLQREGREALRQYRMQKSVPERDDKVICSWNALLAQTLAKTARYLDDRSFILSAQQLMDHLYSNHWFNRRLFSVCRKNGERLPAFLDDYAFLLSALLDMLHVEWRDSDYRFARQLAEGLLLHFHDDILGGFFFVSHDHEPLPFRAKPFADTMMPSGNGAAALALLRFGRLTAEPRYLAAANRCICFAMPVLRRQPEVHYTLLQAMCEYLLPRPLVLLLGDDTMAQWQLQLSDRFLDQIYCYRVPSASEVHPPEVMILDENTAMLCGADHNEIITDDLSELIQAIEQALTPKN